MLSVIAMTSQMLRQGGIANKDWFSDKLKYEFRRKII